MDQNYFINEQEQITQHQIVQQQLVHGISLRSIKTTIQSGKLQKPLNDPNSQHLQ
jgi:hypothetical protein